MPITWSPSRRFALAAATLAVVSHIAAAPAAAEERPTVVATTGMIADAVRSVAGDEVRLVQLMGEGVDPHLYRATRSDVATMLGADLVLYNGLLLEAKLTDVLIRVASSGRRVVAVTEAIDEALLLEHDDYEGLFDPHLWMDPSAWTATVPVVEAALADLVPASAATFAANAEAYRAKLAELDAYGERILADVPDARRVLVTAHDAFAYFGQRYGFEVEGIQGVSTDSEAGLFRIEELVAFLVERRIPAVFVETTVDDRNVRAVIDGARARGHEVVIGGELFSDAMGAPGTYEGTYVGMIDHNLTTIARALGAAAPEKGLHGRLALAE